MHRNTTLFCSALLVTALTWPACAQRCALPELPLSVSPALLAAAETQKAQLVIDYSSFYREKYEENLNSALKMSDTDEKTARDSAQAWTKELMPEGLIYSRDGQAWTSLASSPDKTFVIPDQPLGRHGYTLRLDFVSGKGRHFAYYYIKPTLHAGTNNCLSISQASLKQWKWSKKVTFTLGGNLVKHNPALASGRATALIDGTGDTFTVDKNGRFTATLPFEEAEDLHIIYKAGNNGGPLNIYVQNFANSPQSANEIVVTEMNVAD